MKRLFIISAIVFACVFCANAQTDEPQVCISQSAANQCRDNTLERNALREYREQAEKDKAAMRAEIEDLKIRLAQETQKNIDNDAERARYLAIIEALLKAVRPKKFGIINF